MPIDGQSAWREAGLSAEQRVDRFFNLIEHAVENGVPLSQLFSREHVKKFILFVLKESQMRAITVTSKKASVIVLGDSAYFTAKVPPATTVTLSVREDAVTRLLENLEKLKSLGWLDYSVNNS